VCDSHYKPSIKPHIRGHITNKPPQNITSQ